MLTSTFSTPISSDLWSLSDQERVVEAFKNATKIQERINRALSQVAMTWSFSKKFPLLSQRILKQLPWSDGVSEIKTNEIKFMAAKLQRGRELITSAFIEDLMCAYQELRDEMVFNNYSFVVDDLNFICSFYYHLACFLEKNIEILQSPDFVKHFKNLYKPEEIESISAKDLLEKIINELHSFIKKTDEKFLKNVNSKIKLCQDLIPATLKSIFSLSKIWQCSPKGELLGALGDKTFRDEKEMLAELDKFSKQTAEDLDQYFLRNAIYIKSIDEASKFNFALVIINIFSKSELSVPLDTALDVYCVVSKNSCEGPYFFKQMAMRLCEKIESVMKREQEDLCAIM